MAHTVRRRPSDASLPFSSGTALVIVGTICPDTWMRWTFLALGIGLLVAAAAFLVLALRERYNPLASGSDWEPLPPVAPTGPRPPAGAPVPAPPHPPKLSGPAAAALPMSREPDVPSDGIRIPSCWPADVHRGPREPMPIAPLPGVRPPLRALPPPEPRDPGIVSLADRRRNKKPR